MLGNIQVLFENDHSDIAGNQLVYKNRDVTQRDPSLPQKGMSKHTRPHFSCVLSLTCKRFCRLPHFRWHHLHGNWR
jgi:hypothetical protein